MLSEAKTAATNDTRDSKKYDMLDLGMKITSGFEMLLADPKYGDNRTVREARILLDDLTSDDSLALPTNEDIAQWTDVGKEDNESWMDINFADFERELKGGGKQKSNIPGVFGPEPPSGFGDAKTQADLRKMVERFGSFLNGEDAGIDGADIDGMDMDIGDDNYEGEDTDLDSEDEDKDVSFDEKEFARMMKEMMGMPTEELNKAVGSSGINALRSTKEPRLQEVEDSDEEGINEATEMRTVMERLEAELNEAGALDLDSTPSKQSTLKGKAKADSEQKTADDRDDRDIDVESNNEEVDIDFNLAKNLLESFKSQGKLRPF